MRIAAGILTLLGGLIGGSLFISILHGSGVYGMLLYLPLIIATIGGIMTLKRVHYGWALAGAICSILFPFFGIPALILLVKRKGEFSSHETAMQGDERSECLSYYAEEKKLRLLYESVEQLFDKRLGRYEDEYFQARRHGREFWSIMEKIEEGYEYFSHAATEIVNRKKAMRPAPLAASAMSSAWLDAYLNYEALRQGPMVAGSDAMEVKIREARAKELFANYKKAIQRAWNEEREFRKRLDLSSDEYQNIVDHATIAVDADEWLRKLEAKFP